MAAELILHHVELARAIGTGHFVQLEVPDQTNAFIKSFVPD